MTESCKAACKSVAVHEEGMHMPISTSFISLESSAEKSHSVGLREPKMEI